MADVVADVWVLTETHLAHAPSEDHSHSAFSPPYPERLPPEGRWTAIWSRWAMEEITDPSAHRRGTVAAMVHTPDGPIIVYGTVIAWANEPNFDDGSKARMWQVHLAEIDRQGADWRQLRQEYPDVPLVVAGDFNQDRDGSGWYGTKEGRRRLGDALAEADLECLTTLDVQKQGLLSEGHLIDHICVTPTLATGAEVAVWERFDHSGQRLSDHPTVAVDLIAGSA